MKASGSDVAQKVQTGPATQTTAVATQAEKPQSLKEWILSSTDSFKGMIPAGTIAVERFVKAAALEIANNPKLMVCDRKSIMIALGQCARYGLEPGALLGQAWLIPYKEGRKTPQGWVDVQTLKFQLGYKGLIELARRSGTIKTISAEPIYRADVDDGRFIVELGTDRKLIHKPDFFSDRGEVIGFYAAVKLTNGEDQFVVMSKKDVDQHRDRFSKANAKKSESKNKESVWDTDYAAMAMKTCIIKVLKLCPISIEAMEAVRREEREMFDVTGTVPVDSEAVFGGDFAGEVVEEDDQVEGQETTTEASSQSPNPATGNTPADAQAAADLAAEAAREAQANGELELH